MAQIISIDKLTSVYDLQLDGEQVQMRLAYSRTLDRWSINIENTRLGVRADGLIVNTGEDILVQAGHLGLQVLIAVSMPRPLLDAGIENFSEKVLLVYMSLKEYNDWYLRGLGAVRTRWLVDRELGIEDAVAIFECNQSEFEELLFVKKPLNSITAGNIMEFDINKNAVDSGYSVQDLLDLVSGTDYRAIAIAMALALGG